MDYSKGNNKKQIIKVANQYLMELNDLNQVLTGSKYSFLEKIEGSIRDLMSSIESPIEKPDNLRIITTIEKEFHPRQ